MPRHYQSAEKWRYSHWDHSLKFQTKIFLYLYAILAASSCSGSAHRAAKEMASARAAEPDPITQKSASSIALTNPLVNACAAEASSLRSG
jgi:hypothetical protein